MDIAASIDKRVAWIKDVLARTGAKGIIYGNSGGKDCTLVGALCRAATDKVLGVIMPCASSQNYGSDLQDALAAGRFFDIEQIQVDLTQVKNEMLSVLGDKLNGSAIDAERARMSEMNINPRLRMTVLYALGQSRGYLVAGTGNLSEATMGYFTKWGDGAYDFNPIADLTASEIYGYLRYLGAPESIIDKPPSAGLYQGQTDEAEMGITYAEIDAYLRGGCVNARAKEKIENAKSKNAHKLTTPLKYGSQC